VTGEKSPFQTTGKVLESNEDRQKREALQNYQEGMVGARNETSQANMLSKGKVTVMDENGNPMDMVPAMDKDGKPMFNDDGTPMYSVIGKSAKESISQQNADTKSTVGGARAQDLYSLAGLHSAKTDLGLNFHPEDDKAAKAAGLPTSVYLNLINSYEGNKAVRTLTNKNASDEDRESAESVIQKAYQDDASAKAQAAQQAQQSAGLPTVSVPGLTPNASQQQSPQAQQIQVPANPQQNMAAPNKTIRTMAGVNVTPSQYAMAVKRLAANPRLAPDFDQMFGPGASARALTP
jgi:hypothetical protein